MLSAVRPHARWGATAKAGAGRTVVNETQPSGNKDTGKQPTQKEAKALRCWCEHKAVKSNLTTLVPQRETEDTQPEDELGHDAGKCAVTAASMDVHVPES